MALVMVAMVLGIRGAAIASHVRDARKPVLRSSPCRVAGACSDDRRFLQVARRRPPGGLKP